MSEERLQRKLIAWWALVGALTVLGFAAQAGGEEPARDVLFRYETAVSYAALSRASSGVRARCSRYGGRVHGVSQPAWRSAC